MFDPTSRYYALPDAIHKDQTGRNLLYKTRRFIPRLPERPPITTVQVKDGDRLDLIAARTVGSALFAWRIADLNETLDPEDLVDCPGRLLRLPDTATT